MWFLSCRQGDDPQFRPLWEAEEIKPHKASGRQRALYCCLYYGPFVLSYVLPPKEVCKDVFNRATETESTCIKDKGQTGCQSQGRDRCWKLVPPSLMWPGSATCSLSSPGWALSRAEPFDWGCLMLSSAGLHVPLMEDVLCPFVERYLGGAQSLG